MKRDRLRHDARESALWQVPSRRRRTAGQHFPPGEIRFWWDRSHPPAKQVDEPGDWATFTGSKAFLNGKRCKDYVYVKPKSSE
jgi:hypothetical protein